MNVTKILQICVKSFVNSHPGFYSIDQQRCLTMSPITTFGTLLKITTCDQFQIGVVTKNKKMQFSFVFCRF